MTYEALTRGTTKPPQFDQGEKHLYKRENGWGFSCPMVSNCHPVFTTCHDNYEVRDRLISAGVINEKCEEDTESCCMYVYFKTKDDGLAFLARLNKYLVTKTEMLLAALAY